jgi:hypothetical protein
MSARDEIGRALAAKIREMQKATDITSIVEEVLPAVERLLETPEERRLRRVRLGVVTAALGVAATVFAVLATAVFDEDFAPLIGLTLLPFVIGLGIVLNGLVFTVPKKDEPKTTESKPALMLIEQADQRKLPKSDPPPVTLDAPSVTEHTTHHLKDELAGSRIAQE